MIDTSSIALQHWHGVSGADGASGCIWDLAIYQASDGRLWRDNLECFNELMVRAGQAINDQMNDVERLRSFSARLQRCLRAVDPDTEERINAHLLAWMAQYTPNEAEFQRWHASAQDSQDLSPLAEEVSRRVLWITLHHTPQENYPFSCDDNRIAFLDELITQWEKAVAEEGATFDLMSATEFIESYIQTGGS